jgi:two-component system chemotaxis response regulator CheY
MGARQPLVVLVADDDGPIAAIVAEVVALAGYLPLVARDGAQALHLARERWPALVITDLMMPTLDGAALIAALRADAAAAGRVAPLAILMTASGAGPASTARADAVLAKPFDLAALEALLPRILEGGVSMSAATPGTRELARRLLHREVDTREPLALAGALERLFDRLRQRLVGLVGRAGFAALCTRALHLAQLAYPGLTAISYAAEATPCLRGTRDYAAAHAPDTVEIAMTDILARFIELLDTFIGEALTMRLLGELGGGDVPDRLPVTARLEERPLDEWPRQVEGGHVSGVGQG